MCSFATRRQFIALLDSAVAEAQGQSHPGTAEKASSR
jgi:hypothetical protein